MTSSGPLFDLDSVNALFLDNITLEMTDFDEESEFSQVLIAFAVLTLALLGVIVNLFVLVLSVFHVHGDFRHFVANLALVDIACGLLFAFMGYINVDDKRRFSIETMTFVVLAFYGSFGIMICALAPVSISRIIAALQPRTYDALFSGRRSMLICVCADLVPLTLLYFICVATHDLARWLFFAYAVLTVIAYLIAFVSNSLVFRVVARHIRVVECLHDRTRLLETRQVAVATLAQALVPLVCQVPAFVALSSTLLLMEPISNGTLMAVTQLWLGASPLFDALITLGVIRQYRMETVACCLAVLRRFTVHPHSTVCGSEEKEAFETKL